MSTRPLILITNDDGYSAKGIAELTKIACEMADVVVLAPENNSSGQSHSFTFSRPLRVRTIQETPGLCIYACDGTPVDCIKMAKEFFCPRHPNLMLSGINHGSNSSVNIFYSATMGAVIESALYGYPSIGFSLLNHHHDADFSAALPYIRTILADALNNPLPDFSALNVNIPDLPADQLKGIQVCRASRALWDNSLEKRIDPNGKPYWWMTGEFICHDDGPGTDQYALSHGYVSVVPIKPDFTDLAQIKTYGARYSQKEL